jgi:hypothetical protein
MNEWTVDFTYILDNMNIKTLNSGLAIKKYRVKCPRPLDYLFHIDRVSIEIVTT